MIFFLPLIASPDSAFAKFHANQGLLLFLLALIGNIVLYDTILGWILLPIFNLGILVLAILGMINGFGGRLNTCQSLAKYL